MTAAASSRDASPAGGRRAAAWAPVDDDSGQVSVAEFENMFWLFAVAGNETPPNAIELPARRQTAANQLDRMSPAARWRRIAVLHGSLSEVDPGSWHGGFAELAAVAGL